MTALVPLTTRLRTSQVALVLPPEVSGPETADFAAHGADLLVFSKGERETGEAAEAIKVARNRLFSLPALVAVDDLAVAMEIGADVVFVKRPGWRPFGYPRPHEFAIFGRSIDGAGHLGKVDGDPFSFAFVGPAVTGRDVVSPAIAEMAAAVPPLGLPAGPVWFAAGGIGSHNIAAVLHAGARRVAVSDSVFRADDPHAEVRVIAEAVKAAWRVDPESEAYVRDAFGA